VKLALRHEEGVAILEVSGSIDDRGLQVLKAGLTKLLRDGKNRIALHLVDAAQIHSEILRELAIIDVFARELSGKIILVSDNAEVKEQVRLFAKPPMIPMVGSPAQAVEFFRKLDPSEEEGETIADLQTQLQARDAQIRALEARVKQLDPREIQSLRKENAELKAMVKALEGQVESLLKERRTPADIEGFLEKIVVLEENLKRAGKQAGGA
jgi:anti-anti-sigma regulatory factor